MALPLCDIVVAYGNDHDLGEGWTCLQRNLLQGYKETTTPTPTPTPTPSSPTHSDDSKTNATAPAPVPASYIYYRRRQPRDKLVWSPKRLQLGDLLDAKDVHQNWCFATVVEINQYRGLKVHYTRWTEQHDEWIRHDETKRLAPYGKKSTEETTISRGKEHHTNISLIQTKIDRFTALIDDQNYDQIDEFLEAQLNMFVSQCLGYKLMYPDDEDQDECTAKVMELLELIVKASVWQLSNEFRPPSIKLLELLKLCLLGDTSDTAVNYFFTEQHGHVQQQQQQQQQQQSVEGEDGAALMDPTTFPCTPGAIEHSSHYHRLFNVFHRLGGLETILSRIDGDAAPVSQKVSKKSKPVSDLTGFDITHTIDQMGPMGYGRVMTGDGSQAGNMTHSLDAGVHNHGEKILDTYIWQAKKNQEDTQVYDVEIVYGETTAPPMGYEKCDKPLTPQLPTPQQSFLCYRAIQEDDHTAIAERAATAAMGSTGNSNRPPSSPLSSNNETKYDLAENMSGLTLSTPMTPMAPMAPMAPMSEPTGQCQDHRRHNKTPRNTAAVLTLPATLFELKRRHVGRVDRVGHLFSS